MKFQQKKADQFSPTDTTTILANGTRATGDFVCANHLRVDGTIEGNVHCESKVVLGETGRVVGTVACAQADVSGTVEGDLVVAESLMLRSTAVVMGNISAHMLQVEPGARFNGQCTMQANGRIIDGRQRQTANDTLSLVVNG